ncbi:MAG: LysM peptidoglycan-binding domain-containing protein [Thermoanaerobaculia bacterium]
MRVRRTGIVLGLLLAGVPSVQAADRPPQDLHLVDGHWTAWNPPPAPPEGEQVHIVAKGDTLWNLAAKYYNNPYLWPQIWEKNKYILDAHWIYPGDPLALGLNVAPVDSLAQNPDGTAVPGGEPGAGTPAPPDGVVAAADTIGAPVPLGGESDIYCQGYVGDVDEAFPHQIIGSEYNAMMLDDYFQHVPGLRFEGDWRSRNASAKLGLSSGDIVYVDGGRGSGMVPGTLYTVIAPEKPVVHPFRDNVIGRYYRYLGRIRVISVQDTTAMAEIVQTCDPVVVGAMLAPFEPEPVPLGRSTPMRPVNYPVTADRLESAPAIVYTRDEIAAMGSDHVVHIDVGEETATPGDIFTIYRQNRPGLPPIVMGELAVLSVHKHFSVARILESRYPIRLGDRLQPK